MILKLLLLTVEHTKKEGPFDITGILVFDRLRGIIENGIAVGIPSILHAIFFILTTIIILSLLLFGASLWLKQMK